MLWISSVEKQKHHVYIKIGQCVCVCVCVCGGGGGGANLILKLVSYQYRISNYKDTTTSPHYIFLMGILIYH